MRGVDLESGQAPTRRTDTLTLMWRDGAARATAPPAADPTHFAGDRRSRSIWQWQLILGFTVVMIALGVALLTPTMFTIWAFGLGLVFIIAITIATLAVPWHRVGPAGVLVVPLLDILGVGLLGYGSSPAIVFLWVLLVAWIASYYSPVILISTLCLIGSITLGGLFVRGLSVDTIINAVILMVTLGFVGVIMMVGSARNRSTRRLLSAQSARLAHALHRVTEQKARTRRLMDSLDVGVARAGKGGLIEISNNAFHTLYALDESAQFHPTLAVEYHERRGTPVPLAQTTISRAMRGELFEDEVVWLFGIDGEWRALSASTRVMGDGQVANDGVLLIVRDVTESIDPHADASARRRTMSHELRNPLTAILGHIDLLMERDDITEAAHRQLGVVERAGSRMQRLIDDALVTPGERADETDVHFDLADIARASVEGFAPVADAGGIALDVDLELYLPLCADAFRLRQVVDNVISNAIKYVQRGGKVSVRGHSPAPGEVAVTVIDTGIGIGVDDLPRIFEPDFRTDVAREQGIPGTGLGLGISRDIVLAQGGRIDVKSDLGHGTEVSIVLPSSREPRESPPERSPE